MIDPAMGCIEKHSAVEARAYLAANQVDLAWLTRNPLLNKIFVDKGKELYVKFKTMMANDHGIRCNTISSRNPQANAIVEMAH